jgi:2-keto-4-pentenoate hydratase/2-oxohepta-3-ene-1,7-dioic acid hydratase in catechol pathway
VRILSYTSPRVPRAAFLRDGRVLDAGDALGERGPTTVRALIAAGALEQAAAAATGEGVSLEEVELLPPVPDPDKIVCIGLNYRSHAEETGQELPSAPTFFAKFRNALVPSGAAVQLPAASQKVDYEAEVAVIVGRRCRDVEEQDALACVAGYTLLNDLSARDLQLATSQWMPGKVFDGSAPCGPALVTPDEAGPHDRIEIELRLNGERMQRASTSDLVFGVPELLSRLSRLMTLEPGDIVSTGTPAGVGSAHRPRVWLKDGDRIEILSPTLGRLETTIA